MSTKNKLLKLVTSTVSAWLGLSSVASFAALSSVVDQATDGVVKLKVVDPDRLESHPNVQGGSREVP